MLAKCRDLRTLPGTKFRLPGAFNYSAHLSGKLKKIILSATNNTFSMQRWKARWQVETLCCWRCRESLTWANPVIKNDISMENYYWLFPSTYYLLAWEVSKDFGHKYTRPCSLTTMQLELVFLVLHKNVCPQRSKNQINCCFAKSVFQLLSSRNLTSWGSVFN